MLVAVDLGCSGVTLQIPVLQELDATPAASALASLADVTSLVVFTVTSDGVGVILIFPVAPSFLLRMNSVAMVFWRGSPYLHLLSFPPLLSSAPSFPFIVTFSPSASRFSRRY